jgi:hypothetical protein
MNYCVVCTLKCHFGFVISCHWLIADVRTCSSQRYESIHYSQRGQRRGEQVPDCTCDVWYDTCARFWVVLVFNCEHEDVTVHYGYDSLFVEVKTRHGSRARQRHEETGCLVDHVMHSKPTIETKTYKLKQDNKETQQPLPHLSCTVNKPTGHLLPPMSMTVSSSTIKRTW